MGSCVAGCMSAQNASKEVVNEFAATVKAMKAQSAEYIAAESSSVPETESRAWHSAESVDVSLADMYRMAYEKGSSVLVQLEEACNRFADKNAMAFRQIDRTEKTEIEIDGKRKPWEYIHLKDTQYITYAGLWQKIVAFGRGLAGLGVGTGDHVGIFEETRWEWTVGCYGIWSAGAVGVTVYANLGEDALSYAVKEAELRFLICNAKSVPMLLRLFKSVSMPLPTFICIGDLSGLPAVEGAVVASFEDLLLGANVSSQAGPGTERFNFNVDSETLALIMYTSGTTGDPKGVMITHGNVCAAIRSSDARARDYINRDGGDVYVAYLPLAHIMEFVIEAILLTRGGMLAYGNPRTLTDLAAKPQGDLKTFRPTLLGGVPRVFDTIRKGVESKLPTGMKKTVFDRAYADREASLREGKETPYWNKEVFASTRELLGGRCKIIISGGAPLSSRTQEFLTVVFGCPVAQGYGLTETTAGCSIQRYHDYQLDSVGALLDCAEVKLVDAEEWKHTDTPPRGEICIRGPIVTKGYYKQPEKTREAFKEEGWFYTGDVGTFLPDGTLKIIGRVKALAKNAHGEYIAMESLESTYVLNPLVLPNGVCVVVHPHRPYIAALALTDETKAKKFAAANKIEGTYPEILALPEFQKKAAESLAATAKDAGRKPFELVKSVRILAEEWTPENGVLTAAMKLKRRVVDEKYRDVIAELFANEGSP